MGRLTSHTVATLSAVAMWAPAPPVARAQAAPPLPAGATRVFEDTFERTALDAYRAGNVDEKTRASLNWCIRNGDWTIAPDANGNRRLCGNGGPGEISIERKVPANFRFEYTAWSAVPGDRSASVSVPLPNFAYRDVYLFLFGAGNGAQTVIYHYPGGQPVASAVTAPVPQPGQAHRVVVQKTGALCELFVDGKTVFSAKDAQYEDIRADLEGPQGLRLGFYIWSREVCFDDVRVYALPGAAVETLPAEALARPLLVRDFEDDAVGRPPAKAACREQPPACTVAVCDERTVVYHPKPEGQAYVPDHAVALVDRDATDDARAAVTFPFEPATSGEAEVELLAREYHGDGAEIALLDGDGAVLGAVRTDASGFFSADTGVGRQRLRDRVSYQNRPPDGPLCLQPGRWFTVRLSFNADAGLFHVALVNLYAGLATPGIMHLPLGSNLPMAAARPVAALRVSTLVDAQLLLDNVCVVTPRALRLSGKACTEPLRDILGLTRPPRIDPLNLSVYSLRNEWSAKYPQPEMQNRSVNAAPPAFMEAAHRYDALLVRYALLQEQSRALARLGHYLEPAPASAAFVASAGRTVADVLAAKANLDRAFRAYGEAFRDGLSDDGLLAFARTADALAAELSGLETTVASRLTEGLNAGGAKEAVPLAPGPYDAPLVWRHGRFERGGKPTVFYPYLGCRPSDLVDHHNVGELLGLDSCATIPRILDSPAPPARTTQQNYSWDVFDAHVQKFFLEPRPDTTFGVHAMIGVVHLMQVCPAWWLEQNLNDPDIFFCDRDGKAPTWEGATVPYLARKVSGGRYAGGGGYYGRFNFWNEKVRTMYRDSMVEWAQRMAAVYPGRVKYFAVGLEQSNMALVETGFNESARAAFRARLEAKYGTVTKLNAAWGTAYASFAEIDPRRYDASRPNGLLYEFQTFRQDGYGEWMRRLRDSLHSRLPDVPLNNDFHHFGGDAGYVRGLDLPRMFKTYDVVGSHCYNADATWPMYRLLDSLRKAYGKPLGNYEWAAGLLCPDLFNEDTYFACGLRDTFAEMAWGKSVLTIWYGGSAGFSEGAQFWVPNLAQSVLRYSTAFVPVARQRARRFAEIAFTCPTVTPTVAIMEATATEWNAVSVRPFMYDLALALDRRGWDYGFVYEDPLAEGRLSLDGIRTLLLPRGVVLKPATSDRLLAWTEKGGTLIALLPPGEFDELGRADGRIRRAVLPGAHVELSKDFSEAQLTLPAAGKAEITDIGEGQRLIQVRHGKGLFCLFTALKPWPDQALLDLVTAHTPRDFSVPAAFRAVLRESGKSRYLFVMNADLYRAQAGALRLAGKWRHAADLGYDRALPVPLRQDGDDATLELTLAPAEATVIRWER